MEAEAWFGSKQGHAPGPPGRPIGGEDAGDGTGRSTGPVTEAGRDAEAPGHRSSHPGVRVRRFPNGRGDLLGAGDADRNVCGPLWSEGRANAHSIVVISV